MYKVIYFFFIWSLFFSCDTVEEEYLFNSGDDEYAWAQEAFAAKCVNEASIFDVLDATGDFVNSGQLNKIYKITQDTGSPSVIYVKVTNTSATDIQVTFNSSKNEYDKVVTFTKTSHDSLLSELKIMSCNLNYKDHFAAGGLGSTDAMTLTWKKETINIADDPDDSDSNPETYDRRTDTYTFSKSYPLFLFYYNAKKVSNRVITDGADEVVVTSAIQIEEVTNNNECKPAETGYDVNCEFVTGPFDICDVDINAGTYSSNNFTDEIITLTGTGGCLLLPSAN